MAERAVWASAMHVIGIPGDLSLVSVCDSLVKLIDKFYERIYKFI